MQTHSSKDISKRNSSVTPKYNKQETFFSRINVQAKQGTNEAEAHTAGIPENFWSGTIKGHLGEHPAVYHTLNNFSDTPLRYALRIKNKGYCLLSLETQYGYKNGESQRRWIAGSAQRGKTFEVINGLPPHSSLHLRLFGERDYTDPDQTWCEGSAETELLK